MSSSPKWNESTLAERLDHVARVRGVSQNEIARGAGIAPGAFSLLRKRPRPSAEKLGQIARAWGVSLDWLSFGNGAPFVSTAGPDRYPNRAQAAQIALAGGVSQAAVHDVLQDVLNEAEGDPPVLWWIHRMELRENAMRRSGPAGTP